MNEVSISPNFFLTVYRWSITVLPNWTADDALPTKLIIILRTQKEWLIPTKSKLFGTIAMIVIRISQKIWAVPLEIHTTYSAIILPGAVTTFWITKSLKHRVSTDRAFDGIKNSFPLMSLATFFDRFGWNFQRLLAMVNLEFHIFTFLKKKFAVKLIKF